MRLLSIASGSSGNCICVGSEETHVLVDAGISGKKIENGLGMLDLKAQDLSGILITHEHSDHIGGLGVMARRYGLPMYATEKTIEAILRDSRVGTIDPGLFSVIRAGEDFVLGDLKVRPISISHDAADPVAYIIRSGEQSAGICTDLGITTEELYEAFRGLDTLLLEANHDKRMLETGPYPYYLKRRILGDHGHLSNDASGELACKLLHDNLKHIVLGHLSKENNLPELAYETVRLTITMEDIPYAGTDFPIHVARRDVPSEILKW